MLKNSVAFGLLTTILVGNTASRVVAPTILVRDTAAIHHVISREDTALYIYEGVLQGFEGYSDTFYVPGAESGPTIGYGLDIGTIGSENVRYLLRGLRDDLWLDEVCTASGLRGPSARAWVKQHKSYKLTDTEVHTVTTRMHMLFAQRLVKAYPSLDSATTGVRTAVLSYLMHHGNVARLDKHLRAKDYSGLADLLEFRGSSTGQFVGRRNAEADLIRLALSGKQPEISHD